MHIVYQNDAIYWYAVPERPKFIKKLNGNKIWILLEPLTHIYIYIYSRVGDYFMLCICT